MQLRRAVPLSLLALLASAGCVSVGPQQSVPVPPRGSVPPADAPDALPPVPLPLGELPAAAAGGTGPRPVPAPDPAPDPAPPAARPRAKASRPSAGRQHAAKPTVPHPRRGPVPPPHVDELCAAAEGAVPPSIVDLCLRQYGH
ncbi:hypothetical protein OG429_05750 [Streptomyces sp. NBC_00190]|uniref:hypothetical protein n=1 Tax=unclassified Streptomyces TaxID=2593676 RepID=UPI002E2D0B59|nr:hypothetical protein [Streptomyces sp. NBC_00190]WSZ38874.1 hypothetical protein OG239_08760 [Streptomyces sp. NBC_00868]